MASGKLTNEQVIDQWLERDLTAEAKAGTLSAAFEVDDDLDRLTALIEGGKCPVVMGGSGVGKTALIHELVRRTLDGRGPEVLKGKRIVQLSIRRRLSALKSADEGRPEMGRLIEALTSTESDVVPFFRDIEEAYPQDMEEQLATLAQRLQVPVLGEGSSNRLRAMLEDTPSLAQYFVAIEVEEPSPQRLARMLTGWAGERTRMHGTQYSAEAIEEGQYLAHRFLSRARSPRNVVELLSQISPANGQEVVVEHVIERFCQTQRTPRWLIDPSKPLDLAVLEAKLREQLLAQDDAIDAVTAMIGIIKAGLSDMRRPFGAFLFAGPTGVGKTHLAQILAQMLFGSSEHLIRMNMADYQEADAVLQIFGMRDRYNQERGELTRLLVGHPFAVLLLDELEKSHKAVQDRLLQLLDEGQFVNGMGELISCRSMIIIATTNAGAEVFRGHGFGFAGQSSLIQQDRQVSDHIESHFRFEFLNRFDRVVHFHPLSREHIRAIAVRELATLGTRMGMRQRQLTLEADESVLDWLTVHGYDPEYGARFLRRTIERNVTSAIADTIVRESPAEGSMVRLGVRRGRIVARIGEEAGVTLRATSVEIKTSPEDGKSPRLRGENVLERAGQLFDLLEARRVERDDLLSQMNEPDFWKKTQQRTAVLDRFRELDVAVRVEQRLGKPIARLKEVLADSDAAVETIASAVGKADRAVMGWQMRLEEEGPSAVWLMIAASDPLRPCGSWVRSVTQTQRAWCQRMQLHCSVAGWEESGDELARVFLDVEGPGASALFVAEQGIHRLKRDGHPDLRAAVRVVERGPTPESGGKRVTGLSQRAGPLGVSATCRGRVESKSRGMTMRAMGHHPALLAHLLHDLEAFWSRPDIEELAIARVYGEDGAWVRDPRTGVTSTRRTAEQGRLDAFLDGYRAIQVAVVS